jgi:DNA polymerase-3 subunit gamma/tau
MAQTALYRKWRPQNFATIVGQKAIVTTLKNAVRDDRMTHAYLFSGPRGTGKTSTARIFAKAINCTDLQEGEPCNRCRTCLNITQGTELDVIEIDAASQTGVENIRDLIEQLHFVPLEVRKKVVVIDEVHMLSTSSFNALLKTLEEPPEHVIFILATTEMHKILPTIVSRCQRFEFKRIGVLEQIDHLRHVCEQEQIGTNEEALRYLARLSDGGMRDALSLLDQTLAFAGRNIDVHDIISVTGGLQFDQYSIFFDALTGRDVSRMLELVGQWLEQGKNAGQTLHNLIEFLRDMLVYKLLPNSGRTQSLFGDEEWQAKIRDFSVERIYQSLNVLSEFISEIKYAAHPQTVLELALIKMCAANDSSAVTSGATSDDVKLLQQKVQQLELQLQQLGKELKAVQSQPSTSKSFLRNEPTINPPASPAILVTSNLKEFANSQNSQMTKKYRLDWPRVMNAIKDESVPLHAWLKEGHPVSFLETAVLVVFNTPIHCETTNKPQNKALLEQKIEVIYGHPMKVTAIQQSDWNKAASTGEPVSAEPLDMVAEVLDDKGRQPEWVREALDMFGESLVEINHENKGASTNEQH